MVGLARDSKYFSPAEAPSPHFYLPFQQFYDPSPELFFFVRTSGQPEQAIPLLRRAVTETDPNASAFHAVPLAEYTEVATFGQKVAASLMGALGLMCLLLAAMGLYSVMSYTVSQRIPEIGIRMAMGARPWNVIAMVVGQGMALTLAGMAVGAAAAFAVTRLVAEHAVPRGRGRSADLCAGRRVPVRGGAPGNMAAGLPRHPHRSDARAANLTCERPGVRTFPSIVSRPIDRPAGQGEMGDGSQCVPGQID